MRKKNTNLQFSIPESMGGDAVLSFLLDELHEMDQREEKVKSMIRQRVNLLAEKRKSASGQGMSKAKKRSVLDEVATSLPRLTPKQAMILDLICSFIRKSKTRRSPTYRELAEIAGMDHVNSAFSIVKALIEKGYLTKQSDSSIFPIFTSDRKSFTK